MLSSPSGFIAIDKPEWISSFDVIRSLRRITGIRKIGHSGTLDPFATGLLVCCIGSFTRLAKYVESEDKGYLATVKLGEQSETGDPEGQIVARAALPNLPLDVRGLREKALALQELAIPAYSAMKVDGKRAYDLARAGKELIMPIKPTRISEFELIPFADGEYINAEGELNYRCTVSKGTYIRSLSEWLAAQLGTLGYTTSLRREWIGNIQIDSAVCLDSLNRENWQSYLLQTSSVLERLSSVCVSQEDLARLANGVALPIPTDLAEGQDDVAMYNQDNILVAIARREADKLQPVIVLL